MCGFSEPLPQKSHLGLALRYVPEGLERWNCTRRKASRFSTGLYSLVKVQQVEVAFFGGKSGQNVWFSEPLPQNESTLDGSLGNFLDHLFAQCDKGVRGMGNFLDRRVQVFEDFQRNSLWHPSWGSLPPAKGATPGGRPDQRTAEGRFSPEK